VVVYSDRNLGKIYLIDENQLTSRQKKVNKHNIYSAFPVREVRSDVMNSKYKTDLKSWMRKYSTPKQQQKNPFEMFVREKSVFETLKNEMKRFLCEYNVIMHTKTKAGNLTVSHYITLLQKLTSILNYDLMRECFNLNENYDFVLDPMHKKKTNTQKQYKYLTQNMDNDQTQATQFLFRNTYRIVNKDVVDIFNHINVVAGDEVITHKFVNVSGKAYTVFQIVDKDLVEQQRIKEIRAKNKC
jgi:hypothetical protein